MGAPETAIFALSSEDAGIFNWNVDTNLMCGDTHFAAIFGLDPDEVRCGLPIEAYLSAVWEGDRRRVAKTLHDAITTGGSCFQDYHIARPDGSMVHVVGIGRCFRDIGGEATRYVGVVFDDVELDEERKRTLLADYRRQVLDAAGSVNQDRIEHILLPDQDRENDEPPFRKIVVQH